jgi:methyl-accepting chemotaxis protein
MLNRLTISTLLKTAIALCGVAVLTLLALSVSDSWSRLRSASRAAAATEASSDLFTALANVRLDRANTFRALQTDTPTPDTIPMMRKSRAAEMPALKSGVAILQQLDLPGQQEMVAQLVREVARLEALYQETDAALTQPKSARPAGLADRAFKQTADLLDLIDKVSRDVAVKIKLQDSYIDQLLELKDLAWAARNAGGDASIAISAIMSGKPVSPTAWDDYVALVSKINANWVELNEVSKGLPLPPRYQEAVQKVEHEFFDPDYTGKRANALKALIAGQPPGITLEQWTPLTVARLTTVEDVAEVALAAARERAAAQYAAARNDLIVQLCLMAGAVVLVVGTLLLISLRVISPLHKLSAAMRKLADGDFGVVLPGLGRKD